MSTIRNGRASSIREFVKSHPSCTWAEILAGLAALGNAKTIGREITRMVRDGRLVAERDEKRVHYLPGREPAPKAPPKANARHLLSRPAASRRKTKEARELPPAVKAQTVDEYLANGGKVERLSSNWAPYTHYPRLHLGYR